MDSFNTFLEGLTNLGKVECFQEDSAIQRMAENKVIFPSSSTSTTQCGTCTDPVKLTRMTLGSLYQAAKLYFGLHGGSASVNIKSEQNSPEGEDSEKILAFGTFKPEYPAVIFSSEKLRFAMADSNPGSCLCQKEAKPLSLKLSRRQDQINLHHKHLSCEEPKLKMILETLIKNHSNSTLPFTKENKANLNLVCNKTRTFLFPHQTPTQLQPTTTRFHQDYYSKYDGIYSFGTK